MMRRTPLRRKALKPKRGSAKRRTERLAKRRLIREMDAAVRKVVFERDQRCVRCGTDKRLTASHVYPKGRYPQLRHVAINILTMCAACHLYWWHRNPLEAAEWFHASWPERAEALRTAKDASDPVALLGACNG